MKSAHPQQARPNQVRYAQISAILRLRLSEIESGLDRDEVVRQNWDHPEMLLEVDRILAQALVLIARRHDRDALGKPEQGHRP